MRVLSKLVFAVGALLTLTAACSSKVASTTEPESDSGTSHDSSTVHDGGGSGTSITGTAALTFVPAFAGWGKTSGSCPVCSGPPMESADGGFGGGETFPSGPANYDGLVVVLSDDPSLQTSCLSDAAEGFDYDFTKYHYLTLQVLSTDSIVSGTYALHSSLGDAGAAVGQVTESVPVPTDGSSGLGFADEDNGSGTLTIRLVGGSVQGSFTVHGLEAFGEGSQGTLSGSFDAPSCHSLGPNAFQGPCGGCPG